MKAGAEGMWRKSDVSGTENPASQAAAPGTEWAAFNRSARQLATQAPSGLRPVSKAVAGGAGGDWKRRLSVATAVVGTSTASTPAASNSAARNSGGAAVSGAAVTTPTASAGVYPPNLTMEIINRSTNTITRSTLGKTSGVSIVSDLALGTIVAALKLVDDDEIFANNFFKMMDLPVPLFKIYNKEELSTAIKKDINNGKHADSSEKQTIMAMEFINGRAMSEYDVDDLKDLIVNENNLELLGKSMAMDLFIGNADRIVSFGIPKFNPGNIMFKEKSVEFIDQAFTARGVTKKSIFKKIDMAVAAGSDSSKGDDLYKSYILPLVKDSIRRKGELQKENATWIRRKCDDFECLIFDNDKRKINDFIKNGISDGVNILIKNKDKVLRLCGENKTFIDDIGISYAYLKECLPHLKMEQS